MERAVFFRSLGTMFEAGVTLSHALHCMSTQVDNPDLREAAEGLATLVSSGHPLSNAMSKYPWIFNQMQCKLVFSGERSGRLGKVLTQLAAHEEKQVQTNLKIRSSITTPLFASALCIVLIVFVPPFMFKGLLQMLAQSGGPLPWPTRLLIGFSDALRSWYFYLASLAFIGLAGAAIHSLYNNPIWAARLQASILKVPLMGPTLQLIAVIRFGQTMGTLLDVGLGLIPSVETAAQACGSPVLQSRIKPVLQDIRDGEDLQTAFQRTEFFPSAFLHGLHVGQETGQLGEMIANVMRLHQLELDTRLEALTSALEPLVLAVVGCIVGFTVVATFLPIIAVIEGL
jgi:type IV pilus assembly protein PilC